MTARKEPIVMKSCKRCRQGFMGRPRGAQLCNTCRPLQLAHRKAGTEEEQRSAAEIDAQLEAAIMLETMPGYMHQGLHVFTRHESCRCLKCGCTQAAAANTACAGRMHL